MKLFLPHSPSLPPPPRITYFSSNYYTKTFVNNEAIDQTIHGYFFPITPQLINKKNPIKRACHRWNNFLIAKNFFKLARNCRNYYWFLRRKSLEIKKFPGILLLLYLPPPPPFDLQHSNKAESTSRHEKKEVRHVEAWKVRSQPKRKKDDSFVEFEFENRNLGKFASRYVERKFQETRRRRIMFQKF